MKEKHLILLILLMNSLIAFILFLSAIFFKKDNKTILMIKAVIVFFCPVVAPVVFGFTYLSIKFLKKKQIDLGDVTFSKERVNQKVMPNEEYESQIIPLEETLLISTDKEKRRSMLYALKQDSRQYFSSISKGIYSEDTETSHYAAASILKMNSDFLINLNKMQALYELDKQDVSFILEYLDFLYDYLTSGAIFSDIDYKKYAYLYYEILKDFDEKYSELVTIEHFTNLIMILIKLKEYILAVNWAVQCMIRYPDVEESYLNLLKVYYYTRQHEEFCSVLKELKTSNIPISHKGLELIRFFSYGT